MSEQRFKAGRRSRPGHWHLTGDHALVWRAGAVALIPLAEATTLELETGIASVEALAVHVLDSFLRSKRAHLQKHRRDDAIAFLIANTWLEGRRFNGRGRLAGFVTARLRWRLLDWYRGRPGACEYDDPAEVVSIDAEPLEGDSMHERLAQIERDEAREADLGLLGIDVDGLGVSARWALEHVAVRIAAGFTMREIVEATGVSRGVIDAAMNELRAELS